MGPERTYQVKLMEALRDRGAYVVKYPAGPHGTVGTPDLLACYRGQFLAIECKAGDPSKKAHEPTAMQLKRLDEIVTAGGHALVMWPGGRSASDVLDLIDEILADEVGHRPTA